MRKVGEILREARNVQYLKLTDVEKATKIKLKHLTALENSDWENLPSSTFIMGFIRNYALFLGLDPEKLLAVFRREYRVNQDEGLIPRGVTSPLDKPTFIITPTMVVVFFVFVIFLFFFGYLFNQYRSFAGSPFLLVEAPVADLKVNQNSVEVIGRTDPDAKLTINGQSIQVSENGAFAQSVTLTNGVNTIRVVSTNKFGKQTVVLRQVFVEQTGG